MRIQAAMAIAVACLAAALIVRRRKRRPAIAGERRSAEMGEEKPQEKFRKVLADNSYSPFKHLKFDGDKSTGHPFEEEITNLLETPPFLPKLPSEPSAFKSSYSWIDTEAKLESLANLLSKEKIFSVDTEQHSLHSFLGFTALMQISTLEEDYLIDTIALHDVMTILRPVFADSSICKVFHGADNDILWLQRDFHIYVVNMFDTAKACEILSKPQKSLAYLLETYCEVITDKSLQLGDWRIRPLPNKMIKYARCDAHYLLYISNCLISELHLKTSENSGDYFFEASKRSNSVSLQLYSKEIESSPGASASNSIYSKYLNFQDLEPSRSSQLKEIIWKLCAWRDLMARIHDESIRYILSDQSIASLSTNLQKNPQENEEIYKTILELESPSNIILYHAEELCNILQNSNSNLDDLFDSILENRLDPTGCCPLSIYNYALLSQITSKRGELFNHNLCNNNNNNGGERVGLHNGGKKASRENFIRKFACKSPVYHNCRIFASDGRLLCYCDKKKLEWYVQRNLAELIDQNPPAIMLLFEPKGRPDDQGNDFYVQSKKNICVGCGQGDHYIRYRIIPSCYRANFPEHLKSHRSHDIVLLCVDCHEKAHAAAERHKKKVAQEFGIPLFVQSISNSGNKTGTGVSTDSNGTGESSDTNGNGDSSDTNGTGESSGKGNGEWSGSGVNPLQLRTAAMALLRHGESMPTERREKLMHVLEQYYGRSEISLHDLQSALLTGLSPHEQRRLRKKKGLLVPGQPSLPQSGGPQPTLLGQEGQLRAGLLGHGQHGQAVVEQLMGESGEDGILRFCQEWRRVFVEGIRPKFLPVAWDIKHSGRRDFGEYSVYNPANKAPHA